MRVGIVGHGVVGRYLATTFTRAEIDVTIFDRYIPERNSDTLKRQINECELVFLAVPTVAGKEGECDLTEVREAVSWISPPICIKSTVIPGTTDSLCKMFKEKIVFSPEYMGETPFHKSVTTPVPDVIAFGGDPKTCELFIRFFSGVFGPEPTYFQSDAVTVELAKYMENCFFATKIAFVAQFYILAQQFGADFTQMREIWLADKRVGRSHSTVIGKLGFGGKCLPKDLSAIICESARVGLHAELLEAVNSFNHAIEDIY